MGKILLWKLRSESMALRTDKFSSFSTDVNSMRKEIAQIDPMKKFLGELLVVNPVELQTH